MVKVKEGISKYSMPDESYGERGMVKKVNWHQRSRVFLKKKKGQEDGSDKN